MALEMRNICNRAKAHREAKMVIKATTLSPSKRESKSNLVALNINNAIAIADKRYVKIFIM